MTDKRSETFSCPACDGFGYHEDGSDDGLECETCAGDGAVDVGELEAWERKIESGVRAFAEEMRDKGVHVGLGSPGRCVTCDELSPCEGSKL